MTIAKAHSVRTLIYELLRRLARAGLDCPTRVSRPSTNSERTNKADMAVPRMEMMLAMGMLAFAFSPAAVMGFAPGAMLTPALRTPSLQLSQASRSGVGSGSFAASGFRLPSTKHAGRSWKGSVVGMQAALEGYSSLLTFDSPVAWAAFLLWATPIPLVISGLCKVAEDNSGPSSIDALPQGQGAPAAGEPGIQCNLGGVCYAMSGANIARCVTRNPEESDVGVPILWLLPGDHR
eukprot:3902303-Rhodomonas_salina.2